MKALNYRFIHSLFINYIEWGTFSRVDLNEHRDFVMRAIAQQFPSKYRTTNFKLPPNLSNRPVSNYIENITYKRAFDTDQTFSRPSRYPMIATHQESGTSWTFTRL